jgi:hypothetical protein
VVVASTTVVVVSGSEVVVTTVVVVVPCPAPVVVDAGGADVVGVVDPGWVGTVDGTAGRGGGIPGIPSDGAVLPELTGGRDGINGDIDDPRTSVGIWVVGTCMTLERPLVWVASRVSGSDGLVGPARLKTSTAAAGALPTNQLTPKYVPPTRTATIPATTTPDMSLPMSRLSLSHVDEDGAGVCEM